MDRESRKYTRSLEPHFIYLLLVLFFLLLLARYPQYNYFIIHVSAVTAGPSISISLFDILQKYTHCMGRTPTTFLLVSIAEKNNTFYETV